MSALHITLNVGDATAFDADVLALKYAQTLYGVDGAVYDRLRERGLKPHLPKVGDSTFCETKGAIGAKDVLFVGVEPLRSFDYEHIRAFARDVLAILSPRSVRRLALTIHGPGYGLDEIEAFESELAGIVDAVRNRCLPSSLESIYFVERNRARARRLLIALKRLLPDELLRIDEPQSPLTEKAARALTTAGSGTTGKAHVFVAMPFAEKMEDVFHFGIQGPVNAAGMLCERADLSSFTGDVVDWVKRRIATAKLLIADLTSANPNVYLEVGYAWGRGIPTLLLSDSSDHLRFDVRTQRCIIYKSIKHLQETLSRELRHLEVTQDTLDSEIRK